MPFSVISWRVDCRMSVCLCPVYPDPGGSLRNWDALHAVTVPSSLAWSRPSVLVAGAAASVAVLLLVLHLECTLNVGCRASLAALSGRSGRVVDCLFAVCARG